MKELKRDSWVFKIAYGNNPNSAPQSSNICNLFWRTTFMLFLGWPVILIIMVVLTIFTLGFSGKRLPFFKNDVTDGSNMVPIKYWPKIHGHRVLPFPIMLISFVIFLVYTVVTEVINFLSLFFGLSTVLNIATGVVFLGLFVFLANKARKTEYWLLLKSYTSSVKKNYCPVISIESAPQNK